MGKSKSDEVMDLLQLQIQIIESRWHFSYGLGLGIPRVCVEVGRGLGWNGICTVALRFTHEGG